MFLSTSVSVSRILRHWKAAVIATTVLLTITSAGFAETVHSANDSHTRYEYGDRAPRSSKWKALWKWSAAALIAGSSMDAASSWGYAESNAFLRSGGGQLAGRGTAIKLGVMGGALLGQYYLVKKKPELEKPLAITNFAIGAAYTGVAVRNYRVR